MKYFVLFLPLFLFGCCQSQEYLLVKNKWKIERVSNSSLNKLLPENLDYGAPWDFKKDGTAIINDKYFLGGGLSEGIWNLTNNKLIISINNVSIDFQIIELTDSKLKLRLAVNEESELEYDFIPAN